MSGFLISAAVRMGSGLVKTFCRQVWCDEPYLLPSHSSPGGAHPDDNFDVSSRKIELEQLDVTKQAWKGLYGRTGIKKGYNGLFLEKIATEAYAKLATTTTETDYNLAAQQFQTVIDRAQKEAKHSFEDTYYASADVALLSDAFVDNAAELLLKRLKEPIREVKETFNPAILLKNQPVLLIPSGALTGFNDSPMVKASLDEYVKQGGTLILLSQKHGYDYASIPTPDGRPITGYGWEEDQNCFADSVAIESWHQLLSGQSRSTPTLNVDGYFTGYPANATVLLRRTANGQPAMIMYEHGLGRVIVTSMYSDWAYGHGQASQEEIALIRDLLSWAKKPVALPEIKPGETVSLSVTLSNSTATDAASIKLQTWNPDRSTLLLEQAVSISIPAGQSLVSNVTWQAPPNAPLGIYHIDYILLDAAGNIIQPQAETDSGRFVVSNPPQTGTVKKDIWLSVTSPNQEVFFNEPFLYTFHIYNNTATTRNLTLRTLLPHTNRTHEWTVTATANGETAISGADLFTDSFWMFETLRAYLYDENGKEIASYMLSFKGIYPQVGVTTTPAKPLYTRGETVSLAVTLKNGRELATSAKLSVLVTDPTNSAIYATTQDLTLDASGTVIVPFSFPIPANVQGGLYTVSSEVSDGTGKKIGGDASSFDLPFSQVAVSPLIPAAITTGTNPFSFALQNSGRQAVSAGSLSIECKDPDGATIATASQPFTLDPGQSKTIAIPVNVPAAKLGNYTLSYIQSDETGQGKSVRLIVPSALTLTPALDKPSYRIRESVQLSLNVTNSGKFSPGWMPLTVSLPAAGFAETRSIDLPAGGSSQLTFTIPLPATMTAGRHSLIATVTLPSGSTATQETFATIPAASLAAAEPAPSYQTGETITIPLRNSGGVDAAVESSVSLYDAGDLLIATKTDNGTIIAGGERLVTLSIPAQAVDGGYRLLLVYRDIAGSTTVQTLKNLAISGVKATLSTATGKGVYLSSETVSTLTTVANQGKALANATLDLKVVPTARAAFSSSWGGQAGWRGVAGQTESRSKSGELKLEQIIPDGDFEYGQATGWYIPPSDACGCIVPASGVAASALANGTWLMNVRSNGPGEVTSWGRAISAPFVPVEPTLNWLQYSQSSNVYFEYRILDLADNILQTAPLPIITGGFGAQQIDVSSFVGVPVKLELRQHTTQWGYGWFTLVDKVRNGSTVYKASGSFESETKDYGVPVQVTALNWLSTIPVGSSLKFQLAVSNDNASWNYVGPDGTADSYFDAAGTVPTSAPTGRYLRWKSFFTTADRAMTPVLRSLTIEAEATGAQVLWQQSQLLAVEAAATNNAPATVGALSAIGKMILQATLKNSLGQTIAAANYPFYVAGGTIALQLTTDKPVYRPGESVVVSGDVKNLATVEAANLNFALKGKRCDAEELLGSETFTIPSGGSQPFTVTTTAGSEGTVNLTGTLSQNGTTLARIADQYDVASPQVTAALAAPDVAGDDPFTLTLSLTNSGRTDALVTVVPAITSQPETAAVPAGQTKLLQYSRQISADSNESFALTGDLTQVVMKSIKYGPALTLAATAQAVYPEGKISLPITAANSGLLDSQFIVNYQLTQGASSVSQQTKSYFIPKGDSSAGTLTFDLAEGSYLFAVTSQKPAASTSAAFQVRKETKADLTLAVGAQSSNIIPATVNVTNLGYNPIEGSVRLSLVDTSGAVAWSGAQNTTLPQTLVPAPQTVPFAVNLAALKPATYTIRAELLDAGNRQLATQAAPFSLLGPTITITHLPPYRIIPSGGTSDFVFKVKNSGNQDGQFNLAFKADDLIDSVRSEWLKPGEEKEITFALQAASDLDEKDYSAVYSLKQQGSGSEERGAIRYRLMGLNLAVSASLDKTSYSPGDSATLTLTVTQQDSNAAPGLFARVNYNGYNEKQTFTLNGSQTLTFTVPISQITGEKLFYGIYTESGRSIHLNTIYLYKSNPELAITTDKQVYNPGDTVTAAISGSATGDLTLSGPGNFTATFAYRGSDSKSFTLPASMTAGTYTIKAQLATQNSQLITASQPFDVAGIQVKVKEALLDKVKYAASDTMKLALTIESNRDLAATVRTWVVDPSGSYTEAGSGEVSLSLAAPVLNTQDSTLNTASLGIHKLVYGIYQGDLLLASGAKAFDIGEAVLLGLATDRSDYPEITMPVTVKADLYGTSTAGIELFLDGNSITADNITLSGAGSYTFAVPPSAVAPGMHILKAVLTAGGLTSSRETRFTYGSSLPDLTARIASQPPAGGTVNLSLTVTNQGKTAAGTSRAALYDGDPANGGQLLTTLNVPAIDAGSSATLSHAWSVLGRNGDHVLYTRIDSDNSVAEFIERNNTALTAVSLPSSGIAVAAGKSAYGANEAAAITITLANLTANLPLENSTLKLRLTSAAGTAIDLADKSVGTIAPATLTTLSEFWNTGSNLPDSYTVTARLIAGATELSSATCAFTILPTRSLSGTVVPVAAEVPQEASLEALFTVKNSGNIPVDGLLQGVIRDPQSGISSSVQEMPLQLPVGATKAGSFSFSLNGLAIKGYDLLLGFASGNSETTVARSQFTIKDTIPPTLAVSTLSDGSHTNQETLNVAGAASDNSGAVQVEINGTLTPVAADGTFSQAVLLQSGANSITTIAADGANNETADIRTVVLDRTAPALTISSPADNSKTAEAFATVAGTVDETAPVRIRLGESTQSASMNGTAFSAPVTLNPGINTIEVTATDLAGNKSSQKRSVLFDDQKPSLAISEPAQDTRTNKSSLTIGGTASDPYTAVGITVAVDGNIMTPTVVDGIFSQIVTFGDEKLYPITVTATNEVGTQTAAQRNVIFDKTPPNLTIDPVTTPTNVASQTVTGTREEGTAVIVSCATATVGAVEYPTSTSWRTSLAGMLPGENRLQATAADLAGNRTAAAATILYVPRAPEVTINASPNRLWPPNKKLVPVTIDGNVVTFGSETKEVTISVADEYGKYNLQGLKFGDTVMLESWREGGDMDGRVYTITGVATDEAGNRTTKSATVVVPHDMGE